MKAILFITILVALAYSATAQNVVVDTSRTKGREIINNAQLDKKGNTETKATPGLVPQMIIILNYDRVIKPQELAKIKKSDIIKQYTIDNRTGIGEVSSILIVETKNKDRYRN